MRRRDELNDKGVRIRFAGRRDWRVPRRVLRRMDESIELTKRNTRMVLTMAFNYGGRAEIVDAVRALVAEGTPANKVDERAIRRHLYFPDMPDPDLVIRTSGETGSPTSCSGRSPTASWCSPTCCGPTSAGTISSRRWASSSAGYGASERSAPEGPPTRCDVTSCETGGVMTVWTRIAVTAGIVLLAGFFIAGAVATLHGAVAVLVIVAVASPCSSARATCSTARTPRGGRTGPQAARPSAADLAAARAADARRAVAEATRRGERYCPIEPAERSPQTST